MPDMGRGGNLVGTKSLHAPAIKLCQRGYRHFGRMLICPVTKCASILKRNPPCGGRCSPASSIRGLREGPLMTCVTNILAIEATDKAAPPPLAGDGDKLIMLNTYGRLLLEASGGKICGGKRGLLHPQNPSGP